MAITMMVDLDTEEAILRWEDEQMRLNKELPGGEEANAEILVTYKSIYPVYTGIYIYIYIYMYMRIPRLTQFFFVPIPIIT